MSLITCVYAPTGIILSGDSRTTLTLNGVPNQVTHVVQSDATNKVFDVLDRYGIAACGDAHINNLPIEHYIREFEVANQTNIQSTQNLASNLLSYFQAIQPVPNVVLIVAGYDGQDPYVFAVETTPSTIRRVNLQNGVVNYGIVRGGDQEIVNRLLSQQQFNPLFNYFTLQDAIDFSRHLIRTTIDQLRFEPRFPTVGGPIDTLAVTPNETFFVTKKRLNV